MNNENLAIISAIKEFKRENEIYKEVIKNLIDKDAHNDLIILLMDPELITQKINPAKYGEALQYLMHTYQSERALVMQERRLKAYETKVQGAIEEAKITKVPTKEAIEAVHGAGNESKSAEEAAQTFTAPGFKEEKINLDEDIVLNDNDGLHRAKEGAKEVEKSLEGPIEKAAHEKAEEMKKDNEEPIKAEVEAPKIKIIVNEPKKEEVKKEEPKVKKEDNLHEVVATRPSSTFFQRHKKAILIASGLAMIAVTAAAFPTVIAPTLMSANSILWHHVPLTGVRTVLHGLNSAIGKTIGATFADGIWMGPSGVINAAAGKTSILAALGTYGLWGVYGKGFVSSIKNMFKAIDMDNKEIKAEKPVTESTSNLVEELSKNKKESKEIKKEEVKNQEIPTNKLEEAEVIDVDFTPVEQPKEEIKEEEEITFGDLNSDDFAFMASELMKNKKAQEERQRMASESAEGLRRGM